MLRHFARKATAGLAGVAQSRMVLPSATSLSSVTRARFFATRHAVAPAVVQRFKSTRSKGNREIVDSVDGMVETIDGEIYDADEYGEEEWDTDSDDWGPNGEGYGEQPPRGEVKVGDYVPNFKTEQVTPSGETSSYRSLTDMENRYTVMLFYPADFTFVCPTELNAFSDAAGKFKDIGCDVIGISTDQIHSHVAWMKLPRNQGGVEGLQIPLLADPTHEITKAFGVYDEMSGQAKRATVMVDKNCKIVHTSVNHAPVGRSVEEALRLIKAFDFVDQHGDQVCPVSWTPGSKTIIPDHNEKHKYFKAAHSE